ncbi:MAG: hypothetical protein PWQ13_279 [Bacillota bacterium]|nr:hypothetical protein [Bacillota bacterium]
MGIPDQYIKALVRKGKLKYSEHAQKRMAERKIDVDAVCDAILNGEVVKLQDHGRDIKVVFQPAAKDKPEYFVVVAAAYEYAEVVTVEPALEDAWEFVKGFAIRRRR